LFQQAASSGEKRRGFTAGDLTVTVEAQSPPDALARACADAMWREDRASQGLGMEITAIGPGRATLTMTIQPHMVNGHGIAHGGFIFTLADSAFAFACNSHNERTVAAQGSISFIRPGKLGDHLVAEAREISRSGRSGIYDVRVSAGHGVIAEFRGHSRSIGGALVPMEHDDNPA
jgi:acyl-CoA thioesterase